MTIEKTFKLTIKDHVVYLTEKEVNYYINNYMDCDSFIKFIVDKSNNRLDKYNKDLELELKLKKEKLEKEKLEREEKIKKELLEKKEKERQEREEQELKEKLDKEI